MAVNEGHGAIVACDIGMLAYLKVSILSKTALLFALTSIGIFFATMIVVGGVFGGLYMLCAIEESPQVKEKN